MKTALLLSTYNWPSALGLVLKSIEQQTLIPDEVLIADDGSTDDTKDLIDKFKASTSLNLKHIWHEDNGFRRSSILNKAVAQSNAQYIIQTDGDCILHKNFVKDHVHCSLSNTYLYGSRVSIKENLLPELFEKGIINFNFFSSGIKKRSRTLRIPFLANNYKPDKVLSNKLRGCNLSFWKDDFIAVNGYNEDMTGWGREDSEMVIRMMNNGILGKRIRYGGIIYHIWHKTVSKSNLNVNDSLQQKAIDKNLKWCKNGIDQYLNS
ncbi:hypothetical protein SAMN03097699_0084 [Flavobacteriaceae bacterium MAR_2010_188]|nr:hypothetical protein SAMN03097699_0084 [Flavobacteriaceae bacterium MAR_2010_188]